MGTKEQCPFEANSFDGEEKMSVEATGLLDAAKQALEALEIGWSPEYVNGVDAREKGMKAITSLRQAISEAEGRNIAEAEKQEPVAWADYGVLNWIADMQFTHESYLYTHPQPNHTPDATKMVEPKREPLTDEELKPHIQIAMKYYGYDPEKYGLTASSGFYSLARAIEAAHGIKGEA